MKCGDLRFTGEWLDKPVEFYRIQPWNGFEELIRFVLSHEGQQVVLDHARYLPRRPQQVQDARALLAR
jgi:hypothetical protein